MNPPIPDLAVLIMAGGSGSRYDKCRNKLLELCGGLPLFCHAVRVLAPLVPTGNCVLVVPENLQEEFTTALRHYLPGFPVRVVTGGASRSDSVRHGLAAIASSGAELVAIQDAARPLVTAELLFSVLERARKCGGAIPGKPVTDTLKKCAADGRITATIDRANLWRVETPQVFRLAPLLAAYRSCDVSLTDDAGIMEEAGYAVEVVPYAAPNLKLTYPDDLPLLHSLLEPAP